MSRWCLLVVMTLAGCGRARLSAPKSTTPLMLGQVRYIGSDVGKLPQSDDVTTFVAVPEARHHARFHVIDGSVPNGFELALAEIPANQRRGILAVSRVTCELRHWFALVVSVMHNECVVQTAPLTTYIEPAGPKR